MTSCQTDISSEASLQRRRQPIRAALGSFLGTLIEWYDFYIYATASALIFGHLFFPGSNQLMGTLSSFATLAVGFLARPLGGIIFGHLGDRLGRKYSLVITLLLMGAATVGIGLLPTYAQAGVIAPILLVLLRILQGIAVGGEWGGAVLLASEHADKKRKNFFASFAQLGSPAGLILALTTFSMITSLPDEDLYGWAWRLPFLGSAILLVLAFIIRSGVNESPEFEDHQRQVKAKAKSSEQVQSPVKEVLSKSWPLVLLALGACTIGIASAYFTNTFMIAYTTQYLDISRTTILHCLSIVAIIQLFNQPIAAWLSDKVGPGRFLLLTSGISMLVPYVMFSMVSAGETTITILGMDITLAQTTMIIMGIALTKIFSSAFYAVIAGYMTDIFPVSQRYTGISMAYQGCGALLGGTTPLVGTLIAGQFGGEWWPLAVFYSSLALLSFVCIALLMRFKATH